MGGRARFYSRFLCRCFLGPHCPRVLRTKSSSFEITKGLSQRQALSPALPGKAKANLTQWPLGWLSSHVAYPPPSASPPAAGAMLPQLTDVSVPPFLTRKWRPHRTCTSGAMGRLNVITMRAPAEWLAWWSWVAVLGACLPESGLSPTTLSLTAACPGEDAQLLLNDGSSGVTLLSIQSSPGVTGAQAHASYHLDNPT